MRAVALALLALVTPLAAASGAFHHEDVMSPAYGAYALMSIHRFTLDLEAGDVVAATLGWREPLADLDIILIAPGIACDIASPACLLGPEGPIVGATCPGEVNSFGAMHNQLGPATESFRATTPVGGIYDLWVMSSLAVPGASIPYALDIASTGDLAVQGPEANAGAVGSPHCRFLP